MATKPSGQDWLKEAHRLVREALRDCDDLLERSAFLLKRSGQDNEPPKR